jgi:N-acetylglutamate synthase-like GNAT family acetyltransferase
VTVEYGPASEEDVPAIEKLLAENDRGEHPYSWGWWFVARDGGEIIGTIHVADVEDARYLDDVVVVAARRGAGIGTEFVRSRLEGRDVFLACHDNRTAFYERLGFEEVTENELPKPVLEHAYRTEDLPTSPEHLHHLMRRAG